METYLHLNIQDTNLPRLLNSLYSLKTRSIKIRSKLCMLNESTFFNQIFKLFSGREVVVFPFLLLSSGCACRIYQKSASLRASSCSSLSCCITQGLTPRIYYKRTNSRLTENINRSGNFSKSFFNMVLFPDPDGPEITIGCLSFGRFSRSEVGAIFAGIV